MSACALRALRLLMQLAIFVATAEFVLQWAFPLHLSEEFLRSDDELYLTLRENYRATIHRDYTFTLETNSLGLRRRQEVGPKAPGTRRILVVGDSYTFGSGVSNGETYPDLLEEFLNRPQVRPGQTTGGATYCVPLPAAPAPPRDRHAPPARPRIAPLADELFRSSLETIGASVAAARQRDASVPSLVYAVTPASGAVHAYLQDRLIGEARTQPGVGFVDLAAVFRHRAAGQALGRNDREVACVNRHRDAHWSPQGNALVAEALAVALEARFGAARHTEALNAGVYGWGSLQYAARIRQLLPRVEPDIVLVMFTVNDLRDNLEFVSRPSRRRVLVFEPGVTYVWRVEALFGEDRSPAASEWADFAIGRGSEPRLAQAQASGGEKPLLREPVGPMDGDVPTFRWSPVPGASAYRVTIARRDPGAAGPSILLVDRTTDTSYRFPSRLTAAAVQVLRSSQLIRRVAQVRKIVVASKREREVELIP